MSLFACNIFLETINMWTWCVFTKSKNTPHVIDDYRRTFLKFHRYRGLIRVTRSRVRPHFWVGNRMVSRYRSSIPYPLPDWVVSGGDICCNYSILRGGQWAIWRHYVRDECLPRHLAYGTMVATVTKLQEVTRRNIK